jgi:hypothetical protein
MSVSNRQGIGKLLNMNEVFNRRIAQVPIKDIICIESQECPHRLAKLKKWPDNKSLQLSA